MAQFISFQPSDFFNNVLYTGTGAVQTISGLGFQGDFTWIKQRNSTDWHSLVDSPRGYTKWIYSNAANAEATFTDRLTSWNADGFVLGAGVETNRNTSTYVGWDWKAGTTTGITTDGSTTITPSAYSFNTTSGISILEYTGNITSGAKLAHGLGVAPEMIICKSLDYGDSWAAGHQGTDATAPWDYATNFDTAAARSNSDAFWNDTAPDSVNITLGNGDDTNRAANMVAYCFTSIPGYSKFGSYTGNVDAFGPFIYTGFRPAYFLLRRTDIGNDWVIMDNKINPFNLAETRLRANSTAAESTSSIKSLDILSNGVKIRTSDAEFNAAGNYIYAAFAEFPLVSSNSKAGVAR